MQSDRNIFLIFGATFSASAAIAHLGCIVFGGDWYRFFGAGEQMALLAEQGHWYPATITFIIVLVLLICSLYALSGARIIVRLPLLRLGLCIISSIYLLRALAFVGIMSMFPDNSLTFWLVSSSICLSTGVCYAVGTYQVWSLLGNDNA